MVRARARPGKARETLSQRFECVVTNTMSRVDRCKEADGSGASARMGWRTCGLAEGFVVDEDCAQA